MAISWRKGASVFLFQSPQPSGLRPHLLDPLEPSHRPYQPRGRTSSDTHSRSRAGPTPAPGLAAWLLPVFHHHRVSLAEPLVAQSIPSAGASFPHPPASAGRRLHRRAAHPHPPLQCLSRRALLDHRVPAPASAELPALKRRSSAHPARKNRISHTLLGVLIAKIPSSPSPASAAKTTGNKMCAFHPATRPRHGAGVL